MGKAVGKKLSPKRKRTHNLSRIRQNHCYSVQETCALLNVHKNAVLRWLKQGLQKIDDDRPFLIHGTDLREFLGEKQKSRKCKCQPQEFFCCRCRQPRPSWENQADVVIQNEKRLNIVGLCPECGITMHKAGAVKNLPHISKTLAIQKIHNSHIIDTAAAGVNGDL